MRGSERPAAVVPLGADADETVAEALAANVRALADTGRKVRDLAAIPLPISAQSLVEAYAEDRESWPLWWATTTATGR